MSTATRISGKRLREARLRAGFTQAQLARRVNTSERNIVRWETEANAPRLKHLAAIAEATGGDVADFITEEASEDDEDDVSRLRRVRAELILAGRDDLAEDLKYLAAAFSKAPA